MFVYYNLHKKLWSVKALSGTNKGKVIAHKTSLCLQDCVFKVSQAGRARVMKTKQKNVHAGVVGFVSQDKFDSDIKVSYNPYKNDYFYEKSNGKPVYKASQVCFNNKCVMIRR